MRQRRSVVSIFPAIVFIVCLGVLGAGRTLAAANPDDEQSVRNGAQLYEVYCSDCHGNDTSRRHSEGYESGALEVYDFGESEMYDSDEIAVSDDYAELIDIVRSVQLPQPAAVPEEDWPEWAENPAPLRVYKPDIKQDAIGAVTGAIDRVHDAYRDSDTPGTLDDVAGDIEGFAPVSGATNLAHPSAYFYGTSEDDLFNSIANGTGAAMPGWRSELGSDQAVWDLVNYVRSLWVEDWR